MRPRLPDPPALVDALLELTRRWQLLEDRPRRAASPRSLGAAASRRARWPHRAGHRPDIRARASGDRRARGARRARRARGPQRGAADRRSATRSSRGTASIAFRSSSPTWARSRRCGPPLTRCSPPSRASTCSSTTRGRSFPIATIGPGRDRGHLRHPRRRAFHADPRPAAAARSDRRLARHRGDLRWPVRPGPRPRRSPVFPRRLRRHARVRTCQARPGLADPRVGATVRRRRHPVRFDAPGLGADARPRGGAALASPG